MSDITPWGQAFRRCSRRRPPLDLTPSRPVYDGKLGELYGIYLRHLTLMVLTLGWSRFWGRTRLRRYLWNHFSILGDRFEYRGRGIELLIGFVLVLAMLGVWAGLMWLVWEFAFQAHADPGLRLHEPVLSVDRLHRHPARLRRPVCRAALQALAHALARHPLRHGRLGLDLRRRWRPCSTSANAITGQLLTPLVSVILARPRISHTFLGTQRFDFAGSAGDIYGRYLGYYFLNVFVWIVAIGLAVAAVIAGGMQLGFTAEEVEKLATAPSLRTVLLLIAAGVVLYIVFGLMILPLRCWWQAYLLRYLVARTRAGNVLFASAISTRQMWGFMVLNYLIVVLTLGLGWPWVMHRTLRLIARELWIYGAPQGAAIGQPPQRGPRFGEGLLDMFDVTGF